MDTGTVAEPEEFVPLCVDLDGTLIRTDLLVEAAFGLLRKNFFYIFLLPLWLIKGKANLKHQIARRVEMDASLLPYNESFLDHLRAERARGRRIVLATAANAKLAQKVADHLGLFDSVLASDKHVNLSGRRKLHRLTEAYGKYGFAYAGNGLVDVPIWREARERVVVNPERGVLGAAKRHGNLDQVFDDRSRRRILKYLKALRPHQWLKNLLVFVPLAMSHRFHEPQLLLQATLAFISFGLCASSVYLLNDLLDLPSDRRHPTKRRRPFAAGSISIISGAALIPLLLGAAFAIALLLPFKFVVTLVVYYVVTTTYSFWLKEAALIDVLMLGGLYTLRIIAGAFAVSIVSSFWLLSFSMFLFLSLALVKRYTELAAMADEGRDRAAGRGYMIADLETLSQFGISSALLAVLVLALYIESDAVTALYTHPQFIWMLCPLMLYMISRIWLMTRRGEVDEDPVVFVIKDRRSQIMALIGMAILWAAV